VDDDDDGEGDGRCGQRRRARADGKMGGMNFDKFLKMARGMRGPNKSCRRVMKNRVDKALEYQYRDRKAKKRGK